MEVETKRPLTIWATQGLLGLTSLFFLFLTGLSFFLGEKSLTMQFMGFVLLGVTPAIAFIALAVRSTWGRGLATISLLCLWAFQMRTIWAFSGTERLFDAIFSMSYFTVLSALFTGFFILVPFLLYKLNFGVNESAFFAPSVPDVQNHSVADPLYIGDSISDLDESSFERQTERV